MFRFLSSLSPLHGVTRRPTPCISNIVARFKHSNRVKKRLRNHPARLRLYGPPKQEPIPTATLQPIGTPQLLPNGWSAPLLEDASQLQQRYPFTVSRTKNKPNHAIGHLPVYTKHRKDGTKTVTRIKKVHGNVEVFLNELCGTLQIPPSHIRTRVGGTLEVKGNHMWTIKQWLAGLGF